MSAAIGTQIFVNDKVSTIAEGSTLHSVLASFGMDSKKGVAAAVNGAVVPRSSWPTRLLVSHDRILIIQATQGG